MSIPVLRGVERFPVMRGMAGGDPFARYVASGRAELITPYSITGWRGFGEAGLQLMPNGTNLLLNPRLLDSDSDGLPNYAVVEQTDEFTAEYLPNEGPCGGNACRFRYNYVNDHFMSVGEKSPAGSFVAGDSVTLSAYFKVEEIVGSMVIGLRVIFYTSAGGYISEDSTANVSAVTNGWIRLSKTLTCPANTDHVSISGYTGGGTAGERSTFCYANPQVEKSAYATPYFDGSYAGCVWTGTANASTSTRTATAINWQVSSWWNDGNTGTMAALRHSVPGGASFNYGEVIAQQRSGPADYFYMRTAGLNGSAAWVYDGTVYDSVGRTHSPAANSYFTQVARFDQDYIDYSADGVAGTHVANPAAANTVVMFKAIHQSGIQDGGTSLRSMLMSPYRKSDAWVTAIQTSSAAALKDSQRLFEEFMAPGDYLFPLVNDLYGFKKLDTAPSDWPDVHLYEFTGADPTTDTGWVSFS